MAFRRILQLGALLVGLWCMVAWQEAQKEVRVLCEQITPGDSLASVVRTLDTGDFLNYALVEGDTVQQLHVRSPHNFGRTSCSVWIASDLVEMRHYAP
ncbi:MAG: hypothetical protein RhofKO_34940 [Rhodothermales bacterium]